MPIIDFRDGNCIFVKKMRHVPKRWQGQSEGLRVTEPRRDDETQDVAARNLN